MLLNKDNIQAIVRPMGIPLIGEGAMMLLALLPAWHFHDGTALPMLACALLPLAVGALVLLSVPRARRQPDTRIAYLLVVLLWVVLATFAMLPFLATGSTGSITNACFEAMSALTSTGATVFDEVEALPASIIFWRSMMQWIGGYGIILLVLAVVPSLGINKYSLYTAEASGADNTGKVTSGMQATIRQTLSMYVALTIVFIFLLLATGMQPWDAVNLTFCNISTGGFSPYGSSIAQFTPVQQYVLAASMLFGGINFMLLYHFFTLQWSRLRGKMDQLRAYLLMLVGTVLFTVGVLHWHGGYVWHDALRLGTVQTISALTTTGSLVADTELWWPPLLFLFLILSLCGGMAGSTSGGLKTMRVLILLRSVRTLLRNHLHPHAVNPVRLNGRPVDREMTHNVMVIFILFLVMLLCSTCLMVLCGVGGLEAVGASVGCLTGYGPGLGHCGGFGNYAFMPAVAKWILMLLMLLGRLECLTVVIIFLPSFWRHR